jgi:hypothetical protein
MIKTKKPKLFTIGTESFKSIKLGYLVSGELLLKYSPTLLTLKKNFDHVDPTTGEVDLAVVLEGIPAKTVTDVCTALLEDTYTQDENGQWLEIDANNFESFEEMSGVVVEVFKFNFPSFFSEGSDTDETVALPAAPPISTPDPQKSEKEIIKL